MWSFTRENMMKLQAEGRIAYTRNGMPRLKIFSEDLKGVPFQDVWARPELWLNSGAKERLGYDTQKPEALLERIIKAPQATETSFSIPSAAAAPPSPLRRVSTAAGSASTSPISRSASSRSGCTTSSATPSKIPTRSSASPPTCQGRASNPPTHTRPRADWP